MGVAPAVALAREVDPLGMPELVAHEVEVGLTARGDGHQADHLVQGHAAVDDDVLRSAVHVEIHLLVHQPEGDGLVADERLVVRLGVGYGLDFGQAVGHHRPHLPDVPLLVGHLLQLLDPEVGDGHAQAVVECRRRRSGCTSPACRSRPRRWSRPKAGNRARGGWPG